MPMDLGRGQSPCILLINGKSTEFVYPVRNGVKKPYMLRGKDTYCCILLEKRQELLDPVRKDGEGILVACEEGGQESLYPVRKHRIGFPCIM
jgi:hypothetical protein